MFAPRIGVVGCGKRSRRHLEALYRIRDREYLFSENRLNHPESAYDAHASDRPEWIESVADLEPSVTALCDPDSGERDITEDLCTEHGDDPDTFDSLDAFRREGTYDAVVVASPNDTHVDVVEPLLGEDTDLLCEKPIATTVAAHDRIIDAVGESASTFYPAYNLRSSPYFRRLRDLVEDGAVGDLGMITCHEVRSPLVNGYRYSQERSGGALLEKNCHDFDLFNWLAGADPVRVSAAGGQHVLDTDSEILDQASVVVEYEDGTVATLELCLYAPYDQRGRTYELRGSSGLLRSPEESTTIDHYTRDGTERISVEASGGHAGADGVQFHRFLRVLQGRADPPGDLVDAKKAAALARAGERAVETGESVAITDDYHVE
jgi:myo-inositol 2-dehydrogenase/D-chiro-inositol 1-dehydrogenase